MPAVAIQRPLISVEQTRALVSLDVVKTELMDYTEDQILTFVFAMSNGLPMLGPVWNIATEKAKRAERRVLMACVREFKAGKVPARLTKAQCLEAILPHAKPFLTGMELQRAFNCSSTHIMNLIAEERLATVNREWHPGRNGSPLITHASVIQFLTATQEI